MAAEIMPTVSLFALLAPVILLLVGGLAALGSEPFLDRKAKHTWLPWIVALAAVAGLASLAWTPVGQVHGLLALDTARTWLVGAVLASTAIGIAGLQQSLSRDEFEGGEPYALMAFASVGAVLMVMAADLLALFIGLEIASLSIYALVGLRRDRRDSHEGLFKYFIMGAVFSAIFLYGLAMTYGATGSTAYGAPVIVGREKLLLLGHALVILGLLFKVGAVPFHTWSPDAYTGAPVAVTGFMGSVVKVGGFAALGAIWLNASATASGSHVGGVLALDTAVTLTAEGATFLKPFSMLFLVLGLVSIVIGNFSALRQVSIRRLVAFSSVAHAGYMLFALALPVLADQGTSTVQLGSLWYYLVGYAVATAGALTAVAALSGKTDDGDQLHLLAGQGRTQPFYGVVLTVFVASFAGLPPTIGFLGKFLIFGDLVGKGYVVWAIASMVLAIVGAGFYLKLLVSLWSAAGKEAAAAGSSIMTRWTVAAAAVAVVVLMACPDLLTRPGAVLSGPEPVKAVQAP